MANPRRLVLIVLASGIAVDLSSIIAWSQPSLAPLSILLLSLLALACAVANLRWGIAIVLIELLWGSHGHLFNATVGGFSISLRMGVFAAIVLATAWHLRAHATRAELWTMLRAHPARWPALALVITLAMGLLSGLLRHPLSRVFTDANAWAFLLLAPAFLLVSRTRNGSEMSPIFLLASLYLIARTYLLLFAFTHDLGGLWMPLYQWVRDTRLGEVTLFSGAFPRIFMPSMVLLFPAALLALHAYRSLRGTSESERRGNPGHRVTPMTALLVFGGSVTVLLLSLSRSYWLAGVVLIAIGILWSAVPSLRRKSHSHFRTKLRMNVWSVLTPMASVGVALALAVVVVRLPYPQPLTTAGIGSTLLGRLTLDEPAVGNRWQQLGPLRAAIAQHPIFGSGFGAAVTYESKDPRTLVAFPDGRYTTTAFEWGYLDDALERGLLGLLVEWWFLGMLAWYGLRRTIAPPPAGWPPARFPAQAPPQLPAQRAQSGGKLRLGEGSARGWGSERQAIALGLLAIMITHATSPYLNHPLGLGLLLWVFADIRHLSQNQDRAHGQHCWLFRLSHGSFNDG